MDRIKKKFDLFENIYICKYYEKIDTGNLSKGLCSTIGIIEKKIEELKKRGLYEKYKNMPDKKWENIEKQRKKKVRKDE